MARKTTSHGGGDGGAQGATENSAGMPGLLIPIEQRQVMIIEGEEVVAARVGRDVYVPIRPLCEALGVAPQSQVARIRRDDVLAEDLHSLRISTPGGPQTVQALHLESVPIWLAGLEPGRVREDLRDKLRVYKRWVRQRVWEAFAAETGIERAMGSSTPESALPATMNPNALSLEQVEQFGLALVTLARQQLAFQEQHTQEMIEVRGVLDDQGRKLEEHDERLNKAAGVVRETLREVKAIKARLDPSNVITDEQASELKSMIQAVAQELTRQSTGTGRQTNYYASLFGELHRRFLVSTYKNLKLDQYEPAMAWLREYQQALASGDAPAI